DLSIEIVVLVFYVYMNIGQLDIAASRLVERCQLVRIVTYEEVKSRDSVQAKKDVLMIGVYLFKHILLMVKGYCY
ncbi:7079_t:CDS:1, partial [Paraglomus occultum]